MRETFLTTENARESSCKDPSVWLVSMMLPWCRLTEFGDVISLGGQEVVKEVLKRLLCKAPKHQYEEAFDEARVGPVPDRLVLCVLFLNGPAVGPCQKVPEEDIEEAI